MPFVPAEEIREKFGYFDLYSVRRAAVNHNVKIETRDGVLYIDYDQFYEYHKNKAPNQHTYFEEPEVEKYDNHFVVKADRAVVTCDWHAPGFDAWLANAMLWICKKFGVTTHICAGDLFDQPTFSTFVNYEAGDWSYEIEIVNRILSISEDTFDDSRYIISNHDNRMFKRLFGKGNVNDVWRLAYGPSILERVTEHSFIDLVSGDRTWRIGHPDTARMIPGTNPRDLSNKYKGYHIALAHGHQTAVVPDASGNYRCVEIGGMMLPESHAYKMRRLNKYPEWTPGFMIIIDGYEYLFQKKHTDWRYWLS